MAGAEALVFSPRGLFEAAGACDCGRMTNGADCGRLDMSPTAPLQSNLPDPALGDADGRLPLVNGDMAEMEQQDPKPNVDTRDDHENEHKRAFLGFVAVVVPVDAEYRAEHPADRS